MRFALVLFIALSASVALADVRYDASLGNFPQDQGFLYSGDLNVPDNRLNPSPTVSGGILYENTTGGHQNWYLNDPSINFSGHIVLQAVLNIISSNYIPNIGTGTREGYYLEAVDPSGNLFSVGLATSGFSINTIGTPNVPLTPYPTDVVGSFHTYRLEITNSVATFFIDGAKVAGGIGPDNFGDDGPPAIYFGAAAGLSVSDTELKSFCYGEGTSPCATPPSCVTSVAPSGASYFSMGGLGALVVNAPTGCDWTALPSTAWINALPTSGTSTGRVQFVVAPNTGPARSGSIQVSGQQFHINQTGPSCSYSLSPGTAVFSSTGGSVRVVVTTSSACGWSATSNAGWLTASPSSGSGTGAVIVSAAPNTSNTARSGSLTVAGQVLSATESATPVPDACGAANVTSEVNIYRGPFFADLPVWTLFTQQISIANATNSIIKGPIYYVMLGLPSASGVGSANGLPLTHCFSSNGDTIAEVYLASLAPGQIVKFSLDFVDATGFPPLYTPVLLSGAPSK